MIWAGKLKYLKNMIFYKNLFPRQWRLFLYVCCDFFFVIGLNFENFMHDFIPSFVFHCFCPLYFFMEDVLLSLRVLKNSGRGTGMAYAWVISCWIKCKHLFWNCNWVILPGNQTASFHSASYVFCCLLSYVAPYFRCDSHLIMFKT